jgi:hypothetical protein
MGLRQLSAKNPCAVDGISQFPNGRQLFHNRIAEKFPVAREQSYCSLAKTNSIV